MKEDLVVESGKIYWTKIAEPTMFAVVSIDKDTAKGTYVGQEHLGLCPIPLERLREEVEPTVMFEHWFDVRVKHLRMELDSQVQILEKRYL